MITPEKKAEILVEALPYIQKFHNEIVVIKYGGNAMINEELKKNVFQDIVLMKTVGLKPVVVHGGGPAITDMLVRLNKKTKFINGLRYTDKEVMEIAEMVLVGNVNKNIVSGINYLGGSAMGMCGKDGNMILARKHMPEVIDENGEKKKIDIGFVGMIEKVNPALLLDVIGQGYVPIIAPIGVDEEQNTYNINADFMAGEIAKSLGAKKLILLTDAEGIYRDGKGKSKDIFNVVNEEEIKELIHHGTISGGMIPKVNCCIDAIHNGVEKIHIIDGRVAHSILLEMFTDKGIGTMIEK